MTLAAQLTWIVVVGWLLLCLLWGVRSASLRVGFLLGMVFVGRSVWEGYPGLRLRLVAAAGVVAWLVVRQRFHWRRGGRGRSRGVGVVGVGHGPVVPRRGGGMVVGPRPFDAGGAPTVVAVAGRGGRAVRGVAGRLGRGTRRLEVVGGTAVGNVAEGRVPWRARPALGYLTVGAWLERQPWLRNQRVVDGLRDGVEGQPGSVGVWLPGERPRPWAADVDQLHRDVDRRRP